MELTISDIISIITTLMTGACLIFLLEHLHIGSTLTDRYYFIMTSFYHKLTKYSQFMGYMKSHVIIKDKQCGYVKDFLDCISATEKISFYSTMSGLDAPVSMYNAKQLDHLCEDLIGNVWYYLSEKGQYLRPCVEFDTRGISFFEKITREYLHELSPKYDGRELNLDLMMDVAGDFHAEVYNPIKRAPREYEYWMKKDKQFKWCILGSLVLSSISLIVAMIAGNCLCMWVYIALIVANIIYLGYVLGFFLKLDKQSQGLFR